MPAAYSKLFRVCTDFGAGIAYVNGLAQNFEAHKTALALEHGTVEEYNGPRMRQHQTDKRTLLGHHSTRKIPRSACQYLYTAVSPSRSMPQLGAWDYHAVSVSRLSTGLLRVTVKGLDTWWSSVPVPYVTDTSTVRWVSSASYIPTIATDPPGIDFKSMTLGGGDFAVADFDFSFVIYGT